MNKGFADLCLTTWLRRPKKESFQTKSEGQFQLVNPTFALELVERETGFEPATSTLARSHSTAELLPLRNFHYICAFPLLSTPRRKIFLPPNPPSLSAFPATCLFSFVTVARSYTTPYGQPLYAFTDIWESNNQSPNPVQTPQARVVKSPLWLVAACAQ